MNTKILTIIIVAVLLGSFAQIFLKIGISNLLFLIFGISLNIISAILYFYVLSKKDLSWSYPFVGLSYVIVNLLSILLGESFSILKFSGSVAIMIGVAFVALS
jgi:uncharacterized membrane protein